MNGGCELKIYTVYRETYFMVKQTVENGDNFYLPRLQQSGAATGFQPEGGPKNLGPKLCQESGTNLKKNEQVA